MEEVHMFGPEWDGKARDDGGEDVQELTGPVELVILVDEGVKEVGDALPDHLPPRDQFGVQAVENVFQILPFLGFLGVEQLQELLYELVGDIRPKGPLVDAVVDDKLEKELVNRE
jgi:hypothetical protein